MSILEVALFIALIMSFSYFLIPALYSIIATVLILGLMTFFSHIPLITLFILWLFVLPVAAFVLLKKSRQRFWMNRLLPQLKKTMPEISATEREAIEAGNVWWEKELFCGRPDWKKLWKIPQAKLSHDEENFINKEVEILCSLLNDWEILQQRDLPEKVWSYLKQNKFFGLLIPKEYGGLGFSAYAHSTIVVKIATQSVSAAVNTMVPNSLGPAELLMHYGTKDQKDYYLPKLASGEEIPCFGLTGPEAGSDAGAISDYGIVCYEELNGQKQLGIRLNWDKRYITLAPVATVLGIAFKLYDPDHLLGSKTKIGITLCLIPANTPGVEVGNRHLPLNLAFMNGPTRGKDVFVTLDAIIGGVEMAGQGWRMLMECLSVGRAISLPALSTACGKLAYRVTGAYARLRKQFNSSLASFEGIEESLAQIAGLTYFLESARTFTAGAVDLGIKPAIASAIAKYNMTEMARSVIAHSMDIHAGHAVQNGPRNKIAPAHFAIPVSITVEGANILTRNLIIFGQGAIRCHPYALEEIQLINSQNDDITKKLDRTLMGHIGYTVSNVVRSLVMGLTGGRFIKIPKKGWSKKYYRQLTRMSAALALWSDVTMLIMGGALKRKERLSARLGDILSQLYLASAALKFYMDHNEPVEDVDYVRWCVKTSLFNCQKAIVELADNYPKKWLGKLLKAIVFPWGLSYCKPSDYLERSIVKKMLKPSEFRNRLTNYYYADPKGLLNNLEKGLNDIETVEPILKKFNKIDKEQVLNPVLTRNEKIEQAHSLKLLTESEVNLLNNYFAIYKEIIDVNEFTFDFKTVVN